MELWKQIPGYGGHYMASSLGRIKSKPRLVVRQYGERTRHFQYAERILHPSTRNECGHQSVHISVDGRKRTVAVHTMILEAFVGPRPDGMEACHNDGNAANNVPTNLRWDTHLANNRDRLRHGTYRRGEDHHSAKLTGERVKAIRADSRQLKEIAAEHGISKTVASKVRRGELWSHIDV